MSPQLASLVFALGIAGLFWLDRDQKSSASPAVWIPVAWLWIGGSRMVSAWLQMSPVSSVDQIIDGSPMDRNILLALTLSGLAVVIARGRRTVDLLRGNTVILMFFAYCLISVAWSEYPFVAFKRWIKGLGDLVMALVILTDEDRVAALKRLMARLGFVMMPLSVLVIRYYSEFGRYFDKLTGEAAVSGVSMGKNMLGMMCMICAIGASWRLAQAFRGEEEARRPGQLLAQSVLLMFVGYLFYLANSMTSMMCFVMASGLIFATSIDKIGRNRLLVHVLALSTVAFACAVLFLDAGGVLLSALGRDATLTGRTEIWDVALRFMGNPFVGTGFESFWLGDRLQAIWNIYWWHPNEAHNGYLELFLNLGGIGLGLFLLAIAAGYRNIVRAVRLDPDTGRFRLAIFVATVAYNFTEAAIRSFHPVWIFLLMTMIALPDEAAEVERSASPVAALPTPAFAWQGGLARAPRTPALRMPPGSLRS